MKIIITEDQKNNLFNLTENKGLFKPRNLGSRYDVWNKQQPIIDGKPINQYDKDGQRNGYWEIYYDKNHLMQKGNYINGVMEGDWTYFHSDGSIWYEEEFINGNTGSKTILYYYEDGELESKKLYVNDKFIKKLDI